jgi:FMN phosphatase YigB (HAD superfamily)
VLIGDSLRRDREGARRMGMRFIWIAPQDVQAAQSEQHAQPAVTDLRTLAKVLQ